MTALAFALLAAGLLALAAAMPTAPAGLPIRPAGRAIGHLRALGWLLLAASLIAAIAGAGSWGYGLVEWLGLATAAAAIVTLALAPLRTRRARR